MGDLSAHFDTSEFRCRGHGQPGHTPHSTAIDRRLITALESARAELGRPLVIVSGHRCRWWNAKQGGARRSQHLLGRAADLRPGVLSQDVARRAGFRGLGLADDGSVVHVDVRRRRAVWRY